MISNLILALACVFLFVRLRAARRRADQLSDLAQQAMRAINRWQDLFAQAQTMIRDANECHARHLKAVEERFDVERHAATFADREFLKEMGITV